MWYVSAAKLGKMFETAKYLRYYFDCRGTAIHWATISYTMFLAPSVLIKWNNIAVREGGEGDQHDEKEK